MGKTKELISKQTDYSRCGVQAVMKKYEDSAEPEDKNRIGRPRKLTKFDEKFLNVSSLRDRKKFSKDLAQHLAASSGCQVDPSTVQRSSVRNNPCGKTAAKKPLFQKRDRKK
uniref:Uncharacterized protein n=1 Tax=Monopterus albus TaxID=43700 RepID=A0A3Q3JX60_MONAL